MFYSWVWGHSFRKNVRLVLGERKGGGAWRLQKHLSMRFFYENAQKRPAFSSKQRHLICTEVTFGLVLRLVPTVRPSVRQTEWRSFCRVASALTCPSSTAAPRFLLKGTSALFSIASFLQPSVCWSGLRRWEGKLAFVIFHVSTAGQGDPDLFDGKKRGKMEEQKDQHRWQK